MIEGIMLIYIFPYLIWILSEGMLLWINLVCKVVHKYFCNMIFIMSDFLYNLLHSLLSQFEFIKPKLRCFISKIFFKLTVIKKQWLQNVKLNIIQLSEKIFTISFELKCRIFSWIKINQNTNSTRKIYYE